jgi:MoxR-like ATPase
MAMNIEQLRAIVNDPDTTPENLAIAQQMLDAEETRLANIGAARIQSATGDAEPALLATLEAMKKLLQQKGVANISQADIRRAINDELSIRKINMSDLSPDLLQFLNSTRAVTFTLKMMNISTTTDTTDEILNRPLTQRLLSDVMARNNSYLYGGAGTGKTFIAEEIGRLLGWEVITLNCNQFTSPLDILGGQTIDGYQEGKLIMAWSNFVIDNSGTKKDISGAVLLLDELPKIDPNTAGILNDALAKVKSYRFKDGQVIPPTIRNGKNEVFPLKNLFVIATGNVPLNTIDPDYEANFKQDLSLQDRFIGSTYEIFVDYENEYSIMKGFGFIWIFLVKVREKIKEIRATNQAFVSLRLMINTRETYKVYREITDKLKKQRGKISTEAINQPKTIIDTMDNFFGLFKDVPRRTIMQDVDYDGFKAIVEQKNKMPYNPDAPDFNTPDEERTARQMIEKNKQEIAARYS